MNASRRTLLLLAGLCLICGCSSAGKSGKVAQNDPLSVAEGREAVKSDHDIVKVVPMAISNTPSSKPERVRPLYVLKACGAFVGLTNAPNATPVQLSFLRMGSDTDYNNFGDVAFFRLTNGENRSILLWNVRVQIRSTSSVYPDPSGWKTIADDYPDGTGRPNIPPGLSDEIRVRRPVGSSWRVCIIYSKDWTGTGTSFSGDYEIISPEIKE